MMTQIQNSKRPESEHTPRLELSPQFQRGSRFRHSPQFLPRSQGFASTTGLTVLVAVLLVAFFAAVAAMVWRYESGEYARQVELEAQRQSAAMRAALLSEIRSLQVAADAATLDKALLPPTRRFALERQSLLLAELHIPQQTPMRLHQRKGADIEQALNRTISPESLAAADIASGRGEVVFAPTYFVPINHADRIGMELLDAWVPLQITNSADGQAARVRLVFSLRELLNDYLPPVYARTHEISLRESDGTVLAWGPTNARGAGVFRATSILDLPGYPVVLHVNSHEDGPRLIPKMIYALLGLLALGLLFALFQLSRSIQRRNRTQAQLGEALKFRKAMEDSLITGLRARDMKGRVTYVNPAFCQMVGIPAHELIGLEPPMPYWAPEGREEYERRFAQVLAGTVTAEGFETTFMRRNGERFPAVVYEAPLLDDRGQQTGWMSSIVDLTERRQIEELNRLQQERLEQASRLSTMGELASVLSHELNQPLSVIASYAAGAKNMIEKSGASPASEQASHQELVQALGTIQSQAQRAGDIIHRMHDFVRQKQPRRETINLARLVSSLEPLIALQARSSATQISYLLGDLLTVDQSEEELQQLLKRPQEGTTRQALVSADRVLMEQVILNLTRNAIDACSLVESHRRKVEVELKSVSQPIPGWQLTVRDFADGVPPELMDRLFSMYVSTKSQGLGIGLHICRSVLERFGGRLWHQPNPAGGAEFVFTMPAATLSEIDDSQVTASHVA